MACLLEAPLRISVLSEVTATSRHYVDRLFDPDPQKVLQGVIDMKNAVIGNNKQKANLIVLGAVPRLLYLLQQTSSSAELRTECAVVLGSLAMGTENNIKSLVDCHIIPALLQGLLCPDLTFIEACLRCLRTVFISPVTPETLLYTDPTVIPHLMSLLSRSQRTQEYITQIFSHCCKVRGQGSGVTTGGEDGDAAVSGVTVGGGRKSPDCRSPGVWNRRTKMEPVFHFATGCFPSLLYRPGKQTVLRIASSRCSAVHAVRTRLYARLGRSSRVESPPLLDTW
ncbi:armadillo repeat-containing protein 8 [Conger conger]|uniref:armadillo repeat-containing protein 8 n=1 Tax=Conger conger TaxID=82655 RepID=UPI002A59B308|nr:armadillo repeat-containing protein 8 [Conger conger]